MRSLVCSGLTLMGLAASLVPAAARAQTPTAAPASAGYASAPATMQVLDTSGKVVTIAAPAGAAAMPVMAVKPAPGASAAAPHNHKGLLRGRTVCANCAKKEQAAMMAQGPMGAERIVACAHSKNGVCPSCQALLALPGAITVNAPATAPGAPAEAPGRAVASHNPAAMPGHGAVAAVYDPSQVPEPAPIGVMQANYAANSGTVAAPASIPAAATMQPGHAVAEQMGASPAPFQHKPTSSRNPHIIGHLLGFSGLGAELREQRAQRKNEAHASIPYNNEGTTVNEVPASVIYGRR